jgi:hypothetical protein
MYTVTVDGVTGAVISGRAPGDPLYQSLAVTGGTSFGGLIAAGGLILGMGAEDGSIAIGGLIIGAVILGITYMFFRHGSEIIEGDFDDRKKANPFKDLKINMEGFRI